MEFLKRFKVQWTKILLPKEITKTNKQLENNNIFIN